MKASAWTCSVCGKEYPIPVLARDCEARHAKEAGGATATAAVGGTFTLSGIAVPAIIQASTEYRSGPSSCRTTSRRRPGPSDGCTTGCGTRDRRRREARR